MSAQPRRRRQELGAELRKLRKSTGMNSTAFGASCGWSQSKVSKSERGATLLSPEDVKVWANKAGADRATVDRLVALAVELSSEDLNWSPEQGKLSERNAYIGEVERESAGLHNFQPSAISGLLQTADYARRVMTLLDVGDEHDVAAAVAKRMDRQTVLYDASKTLEFLLTEGALRWRPGPPALMLPQLDRLLSLATLPNVTIGVLPFDRQATTLYLNGFTIFDHPEDPFVLVETYHGERRFRDEDKLAQYRAAFSRLRESAATGTEATALIRRIMDETPRD
ncbi:helix-turn-helix transcriptional regulator [Actinomadura viridis]|uniref:Transcriptional regulator with XRE-family HTH domain n=1 Tax=Actinomadura viridis TaxID=58110 RepID=A0A931DLL4_9ACTN|nr:helix-turn-helix transcriptional regulator [Actinomadura viridis]MBG6089836.1 transcriptional regulator with XRE-family HTH domain [Actinomadura viridis]